VNNCDLAYQLPRADKRGIPAYGPRLQAIDL